jgi:hypothetical protein
MNNPKVDNPKVDSNLKVDNPKVDSNLKVDNLKVDNPVSQLSAANMNNLVSKYISYISDFKELIDNNGEFISMRLEILGNDNRILFVYCHYYDDDTYDYRIKEAIAQFIDVPSTIAYLLSNLYAKKPSP